MKIYPTEIECVDECNSLIFKLKTFDQYSAELKIDTLISNNSINKLCAEIKNALLLLDLDNEEDTDKKM
jgi:hypothetical protein